jgi:hypothetical protein
MSWIHLGIIRQGRENLIQRGIHFLRIALKEAATASNEQSVARENCTVISVLKEVANAVLRVAGCVQCSYFDARADRESAVMSRRLGDFGAVFAADYGDWIML